MPHIDRADPGTAAPRAIAGLVLQAALVAATVAVILFPPATGTMLIVPLTPGSTAATLRWALADGALPLAPGPYPGSVFDAAPRAALLPGALAHGALIVTARFADCGALQKDLL